MPVLSAVLIGGESLLIQCARLWTDAGHRIATVVTHNPDIRNWAEGQGLPVVAPGPGLGGRLEPGFDWLLSIANLSILPADVLAMARFGAVNFHDGPLPGYAGLNAPVWALLNGETRHAVTWHLIEGGIDAGDIIARSGFDILPDDTAFSLNAKAYAAAMDSFPSVIAALEAGVPQRERQVGARHLFRRDDRPEAMGQIDFAQDASRIIRLVRAMDHGGYRNPLTTAKIDTGSAILCVGRAEPAEGAGLPGTVLARDGDALTVACAQGAVRLSGLTCPMGLPPVDLPKAGDRLPTADAASLDTAMTRIAAGEGHWARTLAAFDPARLPPLASGTGGNRAFPLPARRVAMLLSAWAPGGWAYAGPDLADSLRLAPRHVAPWLPLVLDGAALADREGQFQAQTMLASRHPGWPRDLIARTPRLAPPQTPALGLSETGAPIAGCVLCVVADGTGCKLMSDTLSHAEIDLWAARAEHLTSADPEVPIAELDLISPADAAILARINATDAPFDALTLAEMFEAQVARTPDAVALVFDRQSLTYADLNARANRAAHVLRAMGVGPDVPVALCTRRSPDLLIGALAILKAGGAYVPMDPAYPADRLAHFLTDSAAPVIVTQTALVPSLPPHSAELLVLDADARLADAPTTNPEPAAGPDNLAYLIYTSGSTGLPKGVMVEHRNVANFFAGMDAHIRHDPPGVWLALTSLSFDISVLELFWTLARGFKVVLTGEEGRLALSSGAAPSGGMGFGLFYWGNDDGPGPRKYELLLEGAKFADTHGFTAVWTPERHFHAFGGPYPNPSVTGAAVAAVTKNVAVRAGSCVAPLHHPLRVAEEWAVIDNLTNGRAGLGIASGWHPVDFVLNPDNAPPNNKAAMFRTIDQLRRLWRGQAVEFDRGGGKMEAVQSLPRPVSRELPLWLTIAGNPDTWREAGEIGANVLTHLLGQSIDEVADKIKIYHAALRKAGHDPRDFNVTLMLHTYISRDREIARQVARGPMKSYLASAAALVQKYAWAFPAFKRPQGVAQPVDLDLRTLTPEENDAILDFAFERYFEESGLFGTVEDALARVDQVRAIGVTEIACLIDYGIATDQVLEGLWPLAEVVRRANAGAEVAEDDLTLAAQIRRHKVSHLQCTPTMARMLMADDGARAAIAGVGQVLLGGEALPGQLAADIATLTGAPVLNMYGPTETTIWSTCGPAQAGAGTATLGQPIANTTLHILDDARRPVPLGAEGELWIGGAGVTRGYWRRPELTAERFIPNPFGPGRLYATGDKVRIRADGTIDFLGRGDGQVKIRGHRIELGEIEAALDAHPGVTGSVVLARQDQPGNMRLVAYVTGSANTAALDQTLATRLPAHMRPARIIRLERFPETPNRKIDRKALPAPEALQRPAAQPMPAPAVAVTLGQAASSGETLERIAQVWKSVLGVADVTPQDHFFHLGGHSLLAVQAHRDMRTALSLPGLSITDVFRFPILADLSAHIDTRLRPQRPVAPTPASVPTPKPGQAATASTAAPEASGRLDAMARRRTMRSDLLGRTG
jgi:natural product biosynthesis luciferase-like monooxygenase protein